MLKWIKLSLVMVLGLQLSTVYAHSRWILPSHTILSGQEPEQITFDVSISNDLFYPDIPLGGKPQKHRQSSKQQPSMMSGLFESSYLQVIKPDGEDLSLRPRLINIGRKSVASLLLEQSGTYRVMVQSEPIVFTVFKTKQGKKGRFLGKRAQWEDKIPAGAMVKTMSIFANVETHVTRNDLSQAALKPQGKGLELKYHTHPNELFMGEAAQFQFMLKGEPVTQPVSFTLVREGTRHRNHREPIRGKTDNTGLFSIDWPQPGFYLLEAEFVAKSSLSEIDEDRFILFVTFEVNQE